MRSLPVPAGRPLGARPVVSTPLHTRRPPSPARHRHSSEPRSLRFCLLRATRLAVGTVTEQQLHLPTGALSSLVLVGLDADRTINSIARR